MRPYTFKQKLKQQSVRRIRHFRLKNAAKLLDFIGILQSKKRLRSGFLNVDGLNEVTLHEVSSTVHEESPDILILVETKRREEDVPIDISLPGYYVHEAKRSDLAGDKAGGGIAVYCKLSDGDYFQKVFSRYFTPRYCLC